MVTQGEICESKVLTCEISYGWLGGCHANGASYRYETAEIAFEIGTKSDLPTIERQILPALISRSTGGSPHQDKQVSPLERRRLKHAKPRLDYHDSYNREVSSTRSSLQAYYCVCRTSVAPCCQTLIIAYLSQPCATCTLARTVLPAGQCLQL